MSIEFNRPEEIISPEEEASHSYAHTCMILTLEDLELLKQGKILGSHVEEYTFSIKLVESADKFFEIIKKKEEEEDVVHDKLIKETREEEKRVAQIKKREEEYRDSCGCEDCKDISKILDARDAVVADGFIAGGIGAIKRDELTPEIIALSKQELPVCVNMEMAKNV